MQNQSTCTVGSHPNDHDLNLNYRISADVNYWQMHSVNLCHQQLPQLQPMQPHCVRRHRCNRCFHFVCLAVVGSMPLSFVPPEYRCRCNRVCAISVWWAICLISLMPTHWWCWNSRVDIPAKLESPEKRSVEMKYWNTIYISIQNKWKRKMVGSPSNQTIHVCALRAYVSGLVADEATEWLSVCTVCAIQKKKNEGAIRVSCGVPAVCVCVYASETSNHPSWIIYAIRGNAGSSCSKISIFRWDFGFAQNHSTFHWFLVPC